MPAPAKAKARAGEHEYCVSCSLCSRCRLLTGKRRFVEFITGGSSIHFRGKICQDLQPSTKENRRRRYGAVRPIC